MQHVGCKAIAAAKIIHMSFLRQQAMKGFVIPLEHRLDPAIPFQYRPFIRVTPYQLFTEVGRRFAMSFDSAKFTPVPAAEAFCTLAVT
jgi:hypothetical protein